MNHHGTLGGQHGQEGEEGEEGKEEDQQEEVGLREPPLLRHIKARALCHREADIAAI
jgi:hypothetical protein